MTTAIFDGLTVLDETAGAGEWRARLRVEPESRAFAGHFEGEPILPGVALLLIVAHALRGMEGASAAVRGLPFVRFRRAIRPGDVFDVTARAEGGGGRFEVHVGGELAAAGVVRTSGDG